VSYAGTLLVGAHHRNPAAQIARDAASGVWLHLHGIVVTLVALAFTGSVVAGFLLEDDYLAAILSGWIGLLSIAVGITYHSLGERRG
jgi:hypothetical protein